MCGRFVAASAPADIAAYFDALLPDAVLPPKYNVAPTDDIYAVVDHGEGRRLEVFSWGLVPFWAKDRKIAAKMINARAETLNDKPVFAELLAKKRCLIPADGFYEWKHLANASAAKKTTKQPYYITRPDGEPLAMAGLWTTWRDKSQPDSERLYTATIITTAANATVSPLHDRMPVMVPMSRWSTWLDPDMHDRRDLQQFLLPAPDNLLELYAVSTDVNSVRNQSPHLIERVEGVSDPDAV